MSDIFTCIVTCILILVAGTAGIVGLIAENGPDPRGRQIARSCAAVTCVCSGAIMWLCS